MAKKEYFILGFLILIMSCHKEKVQIIPFIFEDYVEVFFQEANLRGQDIRLVDFNLEIDLVTIEDNNVAGRCIRNRDKIEIDKGYWEDSDPQEKEWLIFHELGHCILDRNHRNEHTVNGECISFMKGAENDFECFPNLYSSFWRNYYLDELFDASTPLPDWYIADQEYQAEYAEEEYSVFLSDSLAAQIIVDTIDFSGTDNYAIDFEFNNWNTDFHLVQIHLGNLAFKNCNTCLEEKIKLYSQVGTLYREYYQSNDISFDSNSKLSIRRRQGVLQFFVNERFIHAMETDLVEGNDLRTINFGELIYLDLKIYLDN
jgi:hypothetical protein